jgi:hypothetical protein
VVPERHLQLLGDAAEDRAQGLLPVGVLMRVEMVGQPPQEPLEELELQLHLLLDRGGVASVDERVDGCPAGRLRHPFREVHVQSDTELRIVVYELGGCFRRRLAHHQAGAGDNAFAVGAGDAFVDAGAEAQVVGIDDQLGHRPSLSRSSRNSPYQS